MKLRYMSSVLVRNERGKFLKKLVLHWWESITG